MNLNALKPVGPHITGFIRFAHEGEGDRMPLNRAPLSVAQQALFFDWIRLGAPLSRLGFEDR